MKTIKECITNEYIMEAACKDLHNPRKGSTLYIMKEGTNNAIPVKVENVRKIKQTWYSKGGYDIMITLEDNPLITYYTECHFSSCDYSIPKLVNTIAKKEFDNIYTIYIGCTASDIQKFINTQGAKKSEELNNRITELKTQLMQLEKEKAIADEKASFEIYNN